MTSGGGLFNIAIATIFAREVLEGSIIVVNYRSIIHNKDDWTEQRKQEALRTVSMATALATFVATLVVIAVAVPLGILGRDLDDHYVAWVEGCSKVIATVFILHFSLKIPVWLGVYDKVPLCGIKSFCKKNLCGKKKNNNNKSSDEEDQVDDDDDDKKDDDGLDALTLAEIRFNVMWNLWREVAECGVFLIPFFLQKSGTRAIPLSALVGIAVSLCLAVLIYQANRRLQNKNWLAAAMSGLTLLLSVGLLVGAVGEFEEIAAGGEEEEEEHSDEYVYVIEKKFWADDRFPMVIFKPLGYTDKRSKAQICCFWLYLAFGLCCHYILYARTMQQRRLRAQDGSSSSSIHSSSKDVATKTLDPAEEEEDDISSDEDNQYNNNNNHGVDNDGDKPRGNDNV